MQSFIDRARAFPTELAERHVDFTHLARGQRPQALFISCSDSRLVPPLITGARPGEVFELRTAGNIVPRHQPGASCAVGATLEYALTALQVPDVVVCGHSHCGAVQALLSDRAVAGMPLVDRWLQQAAYRRRPVSARQDLAAQAHLRTQLDHLRSYPCVAERLRDGRLRLHGWFYEITTGRVLTHDAGSGAFGPL
ncbi:carbonic anhydrase [Streptomyces sp. IBSNAI002]|uniref:carbonic anhydrase n=1 Tax=Streptomyces sp. IBSNAI002 TaxID=3457500 RepID=UPI003FD0B3D9